MNRPCLLVVSFALLLATGARSIAEPSDADKALLEKVSKKLVAASEAVPGFEWPPDFQIVDRPGINAFSRYEDKGGKKYPQVRIHNDMLTKVIKGNEDMLALVIGHEVGHIIHKHILFNAKRDRTEFLRVTYWRDEEIEADLEGARLMMKAGYDLKKGMKYIEQMNALGLNYSSLEGLGSDHPSWNDRMTKLDKSRELLWKSMAAFDNGTTFLMVEQYALAEDCFERVVKEFPDCYEAWVNLGNACLMRYFDKFDVNDIKAFNLGHVLTPGFYLRADSIATRGIDDKLWKKAVASLNKALEIKKDLTLARSNLGLAYLFHPEGKDVKKAISYMQAAADDVAGDKSVARFHHATILVNLGVAYLGANDVDKGLMYFDRGLDTAQIVNRDGTTRDHPVLVAAEQYTFALVLGNQASADAQKKALGLYEKFLSTSNSASIWWDAAYDKYKELAKKLSLEAKAKETFKPTVEPLRPALSLKLKSGAEVALAEDVADVLKRLGPGLQNTVITGQNLKRVHYEKEGVDLLVNDSVVAICIISPDAAPVTLRGKGSASAVSVDLKVGMSRLEVEKALGQGEKQIFTDPTVEHFYYRSQGVGLHYKDGKVDEIVVATIPSAKK